MRLTPPALPATFFLLASLMPLLAGADVLDLPAPTETAPHIDKPAKGSTMSAVERQYGQPLKKHPAVGGGRPQQPPITRWDYPGFTVFFEHQHVVDAVIPGQPPPVQHRDELQTSTP
ncbi:phosphodiesterase [Stagnimonas aquatica]|uniref:Phosphodiesterase n=1 Tax=Stagnimonas aquatica TaxID=2689987 RepID=A0A3N0VIH7_9GAMM|nr:phosphodiesterase [Stagnimonas aquatica]ROH92018.1 phosphodiesterase [Stagnimonas aquatica]